LTEDERDLYAAFLDLYVPALKKFTGTNPAIINLVNTTAPLDLGHELKENKDCFSGIAFDKRDKARNQLHTFDARLVSGREVRLVDLTQQSAIRNAITHGVPTTIVGNTALETNFLQLSEIAFDSTHQYAMIRYTFSCGNICAQGGVVVFAKARNRWRDDHRPCIGWIS
jgi:hypothetical protein